MNNTAKSNNAAPKYIVRGVNDEKDYCECCGKTGLKKVVWIENVETSEVMHFGVVCATQPQKGFGVDTEIKRAINEHKEREKALWSEAFRIYRKERGGKLETDPKDIYSHRVADQALYAECLAQAKINMAAHYARMEAYRAQQAANKVEAHQVNAGDYTCYVQADSTDEALRVARALPGAPMMAGAIAMQRRPVDKDRLNVWRKY